MSGINVRSIDETESDLTVVNAARVSFAKEASWVKNPDDTLQLRDRDVGLINFLAKNNHWSPLAHPHLTLQLSHVPMDRIVRLAEQGTRGMTINQTAGGDYIVTASLYWWATRSAPLLDAHHAAAVSTILLDQYPVSAKALGIKKPAIVGANVLQLHDEKPLGRRHITRTFHVKAPLFVARQLVKHQEDLVWNEVSRRYVDDKPTFHTPQWRKRAPNVKQGSQPFIEGSENERWFRNANEIFSEVVLESVEGYEALLDDIGVAPEQARALLPQAMYTEWYWTGTLDAFDRVLEQRLDSHAQGETRLVAEQIEELLDA